MSTWIYGAGGFAKRLRSALENQGINISGLLTQLDFEQNFTVNPEDTFYLGIFNHIDNPNEIISFLHSKGVVNLVNPSEAIKKVSSLELDTYFLSSAPENLCTDNEVRELLNLLSDSSSKQILTAFHNYQTKGEIKSLVRNANHDQQYLGKYLPESYARAWLRGKIRWIDCGAYIGDTVEAVTKASELGQDSFLNLEPDIENYKSLILLTSSLKIDSVNLQAACGARSGIAQISKSGGLSTQISKNLNQSPSSTSIPIIALDEIAGSWLPTHIKMDIEGSEMEAIQGARQIIKRFRPNLAIAVYHKPKDIYEIPKYLSELVPSYQFFLRTYGAHGYDTVLYAIPKD